jgi:hypothetical protein
MRQICASSQPGDERRRMSTREKSGKLIDLESHGKAGGEAAQKDGKRHRKIHG